MCPVPAFPFSNSRSLLGFGGTRLTIVKLSHGPGVTRSREVVGAGAALTLDTLGLNAVPLQQLVPSHRFFVLIPFSRSPSVGQVSEFRNLSHGPIALRMSLSNRRHQIRRASSRANGTDCRTSAHPEPVQAPRAHEWRMRPKVPYLHSATNCRFAKISFYAARPWSGGLKGGESCHLIACAAL